MMSSQGAVSPAEIALWRKYIGRSEVRRGVLDLESLRRFALAVGASVDVDREPPPLGHWAFFPDAVPAHQLGEDGHAKRGVGLFPPVRLPRRLFAAASIHFEEPLELGEEAALTLTLVDVRHRIGKSGNIVLIDIERRLGQGGRDRVVELQTMVYREPGLPMAPVGMLDRRIREGEQLWTPRSVELFRFSAVTLNAHRIHYDQRYATRVEGYPDLVVHGPLTAIKLFSFAQSRWPRPIRRFRFRALQPLFVDQPALLTFSAEPDRVDCIRCDGSVAMSATATDLESTHEYF